MRTVIVAFQIPEGILPEVSDFHKVKIDGSMSESLLRQCVHESDAQIAFQQGKKVAIIDPHVPSGATLLKSANFFYVPGDEPINTPENY